MRQSKIRAKAVIREIHRNGVFMGHLEDNPDHTVSLTVSGKMKIGRITIVAGDLVDVELSAYDLARGRIVWRHHE